MRLSLAASLLVPALVIVAAYWDTWAVLIRKLLEDDTYQHGLLVPLIAAYLIWRNANRFERLQPRAYPLALVGLLFLGFFWALGHLAGVRVVEQYAAVALIPMAVVAVLGVRAGREFAFPLAFLFLTVPVGQALVPHLMEFTATFTVGAVRLTGIPVYREGLFFSLPSGDFEVAKACSGIRYLMASVTTGTLFAYLFYRSPWRRLAFIAFAIALPMLANGVRAYLIVVVAHLSDLKYATGADHLVYGWLFFGLVMAFMIWVGLRFPERSQEEPARDPAGPLQTDVGVSASRRVSWAGSAAAALAALAAPAYVWAVGAVARPQLPAHPVLRELPQSLGCWRLAAVAGERWRPAYSGAIAEAAARYVKHGASVDVFVAEYAAGAGDDREMISYRNQIQSAGENSRDLVGRRLVSGASRSPDLQVGEVSLARETSGASERLVWYWFESGGLRTLSPYRVKLDEALQRLAGTPDPQRLVAISAARNLDDSDDQLRQSLAEFTDAWLRSTPAAGFPTGSTSCP